jgi:hypothetical protein
MRRAYMNAIEALSSTTDTIYDELHAPHWNPAIEEQGDREREEVKDILTDVEQIKSDPEAWAEDEESEMDAENGADASEMPEGTQKTAAARVAARFLAQGEQG